MLGGNVETKIEYVWLQISDWAELLSIRGSRDSRGWAWAGR